MADRAAAAARAVDDGQARRAMLVQFPTRLFDWFMRAATRRRRAHDLFDAHVGCVTVISHDAATHVALGDNTDQLLVCGVRDDRRAAAPRVAYRARGVYRRIFRRAA